MINIKNYNSNGLKSISFNENSIFYIQKDGKGSKPSSAASNNDNNNNTKSDFLNNLKADSSHSLTTVTVSNTKATSKSNQFIYKENGIDGKWYFQNGKWKFQANNSTRSTQLPQNNMNKSTHSLSSNSNHSIQNSNNNNMSTFNAALPINLNANRNLLDTLTPFPSSILPVQKKINISKSSHSLASCSNHSINSNKETTEKSSINLNPNRSLLENLTTFPSSILPFQNKVLNLKTEKNTSSESYV
jgi:hypothetical protein